MEVPSQFILVGKLIAYIHNCYLSHMTHISRASTLQSMNIFSFLANIKFKMLLIREDKKLACTFLSKNPRFASMCGDFFVTH